jgi:hypothetical protein
MNFALILAASRLPGISVSWSPSADTSTESAVSAIATAPSPEAEEARLESLVLPGGASDSTRTAALQQFAAQSTQNAITSVPTAMRSNRAPNNALEREDQALAGLLIGSPEFQRR